MTDPPLPGKIKINLPSMNLGKPSSKGTIIGKAIPAPPAEKPWRIPRRAMEKEKLQHKRPISEINSRTSSSRVAQLVQKRTVLWNSSSRRR